MSKKKRISLHGSIVLSGKAMGKEEDFRQDRDKPLLAPEGYADHLLAEGFAYVPDKTKKSQEPPAGTGSQGSKSPKDPPIGGGAGDT
ncbi:hypothetical protein [Pseudovibrio brasiliensis]|uniref:Uncharacterized protein n=1 Tax=Pseudovibrio brasiliensis TaxID=1898042 RepID=A0ABX8AUH0_9HYPH|nr:hypothetical protein [Pseudovibrio brasiliensis]QUS57351.1 hypothetical protein KGB56_08160 [Pseudovibrio brasiliensis]